MKGKQETELKELESEVEQLRSKLTKFRDANIKLEEGALITKATLKQNSIQLDELKSVRVRPCIGYMNKSTLRLNDVLDQ